MLSYFRKPTANQLMIDELGDAERSLLQAQSGLEWATAQVTYNKARVARLKADIQLAGSLTGNISLRKNNVLASS